MGADSTTALVAAALAIATAFLASLPVLYRLLTAGGKTSRKPLPPSSFGLPVVGQTLSLLRALRANTAEEWLRRRAVAYGLVSRLSLFRRPTAFLVGPSANKFLFTSPARTTTNSESFSRMVGRRTVRNVAGDEHARVRAVMAWFLRPEAVKRHATGMDAEVRRHLDARLRGRSTVAVMPSMKSLTFDVVCKVLFGLRRDAEVRRVLSTEFQQLARGIWAVPVKTPGEALSWDDLCKMNHTWAAVMETLRLIPTPFSILRKALDDVKYGWYLIPKGWSLMNAMTMTHWDPAIFPDPGRFDLAQFEDPSSAIPAFSFVPFGGGTRFCPGNEFARAETLVAVHHIVTRFRLKLAASCDGSFSRYPMPCPSQGLLVDIEAIH